MELSGPLAKFVCVIFRDSEKIVGSATLVQLAFLGKNDPNYWDNKVFFFIFIERLGSPNSPYCSCLSLGKRPENSHGQKIPKWDNKVCTNRNTKKLLKGTKPDTVRSINSHKRRRHQACRSREKKRVFNRKSRTGTGMQRGCKSSVKTGLEQNQAGFHSRSGYN